ncbi:4-(cytidine 5'-diphospho)-2-C-methyl-D-erythritol kinase [Duncaniella freteri]|jgi:4-diphosphocytidyl-2-C-methyl-D-erythritol kinase|uniref:4-diphosphocytidyl-2-C-methyl-D-erythritol kinase n=3 Tax=Duncaniella TaxID=2518495 RepID=A0A4Z0V355_9BACT|nr:4-(cytidine 5'-diphospho)-2-C-methyl-D-erythritol kinase [Duncaniella freteri]MDE7026669.1 4-(cytidine 5'-diphospho)-2-C-methyl-D-erythritol kinase [Duncaniella freteri]TGG39609.1 4-(cytidine 5'-diphospho)-2-C-methyl-D-erythritol kinase [Duncaniella freteri]
MILFPNAKINLGLDILRKRPDGYHDIETVMVPVPWCDVLEIVPAKGSETTLTVSGRKVECPMEKNLVMKAYRALEAEVSLPPVDIYLRKIIPDGAGLGGGSSDASFTLLALNELFSLGYNREELARIASTLGSDCPFFIYNTPMLCTGTGTDMEPVELDLKGHSILIVKPQVSVPTAAAYSHTTPAIPSTPIRDIIASPISSWEGRLKNDFEPSVLPAYPAIADVKRSIKEMNPIYTAMSGSGASVFGIFGNDILSPVIRERFQGCDTLVATL